MTYHAFDESCVSYVLTRESRHPLHDKDTRCVKFIYHLFWRDANGTHKKRYFVFDYNIRELVQLSIGIVILLADVSV